MAKAGLLTLLICMFSVIGFAQLKYAAKIEAGYLKFQNHTVKVDPGPGWKGYHLQEEQNGVDLNVVNGIRVGQRFFAGIGAGYVNFQGINGVSLFGDVDVTLTRTRLAPFIDLRVGYNHIWNQYDGGTSSALFEGGAGARYCIAGRYSLYMQTGILLAQQPLLFPLRLGVNF